VCGSKDKIVHYVRILKSSVGTVIVTSDYVATGRDLLNLMSSPCRAHLSHSSATADQAAGLIPNEGGF
jgi:hypothetical protein